MKQIIIPCCLLAVLCIVPGIAFAGWNTCIGCHNGGLAPDKAKLADKHKTIEAFVKAAQASQNPMMQAIKSDEKALKEAAQEIGLK